MNTQELAGVVKELQARTNAVTQQAKDARERLATLEGAIPESIAMGDAAQTRELRDERASLETILRDHEVAERVLSRKLEDAVQELAAARLPEVLRAAEVARDRLETTAERTRTDVQAFLDLRRSFLETRNRARRGDGHPSDNVQLRTRLAAAIVGVLRDGFGAV